MAAPAAPQFLYQIRNGFSSRLWLLRQSQREQMSLFKEKQRGEVRDLLAEEKSAVANYHAARRAAKEERAKKMREDVLRADAARASLAVMLETLEKARAAAAAAGVDLNVEWKYPPKAAQPPPAAAAPLQPLTHWQKFLKRVGGLLSENGVELLPGNRDVRLLAIFCSKIRYAVGEDADDKIILKLARAWDTPEGRVAREDYHSMYALASRLKASP